MLMCECEYVGAEEIERFVCFQALQLRFSLWFVPPLLLLLVIS